MALWRRYRTLPLWGQIVTGILFFALITGPFTSAPEESASESPTTEPPQEEQEETTVRETSTTTTTAAPVTTTAPALSPAEEEEAIRQSREGGLRDALAKTLGAPNREGVEGFSLLINWPEASVLVTWAIDEGLTEGLTKDQARRQATDIIKVVRESEVEFALVTLEGTYSLVDQFGNASEERVVLARYTVDTVNRINFDNFQYKNIFEIAEDGAFVHPAFRY